MAHVLLFHHAQGLTAGVQDFAEQLRAAGHEVTVPDLYEGRTFATLEEGVAYSEALGLESIIAAGVEIAARLPRELVYAGFSLGVLPAQRLAQQRDGARGALLYHSGVPASTFGDAWPAAVPLQLHVMRDDPFDELDTAEQLVEDAGGQLLVYEGSTHLFTDSSLADHDPDASRLVLDRTLDFLAAAG